MTTKTRVTRKVVAAPQNLDEAADCVSQIGDAQQAIGEIEQRAADEIEAARTQAEIQARDYRVEIDRLFEGLFAFAQSRRQELTCDGKRKTVSLVSGEFGWRITPISISIRNRDEVVATLERLGLSHLIRILKEPNKTEMHKDPDAVRGIKGVTVKGGGEEEDFFVKPQKITVEVARGVDKLKKACAA